MRHIFTFIMLCILGNLMSIELVHKQGKIETLGFEYFQSQPRMELKAELEKKGKPVNYSWKGFRFDNWLKDNGYTEFTNIRFESEDRYQVSLSHYEFSQNECWMMFEENGEELNEDSFRIVFPALRQMYWINGIIRIVLEDFEPLKMPEEFFFMDKIIAKQKLHDNPAPFVRIRGYYMDDLIKKHFGTKNAQVLMYSRDGLKLRMEYPKHLKGAVLELSADGKYNLKSQNIPGGMWLNDIVFIQFGKRAMIREAVLGDIVELNRVLSWGLQSPFEIRQKSGRRKQTIEMADLLGGKVNYKLWDGFEIIAK